LTDQLHQEDVEDALVDGDRAWAPGTAMAALANRDFRIVWGGTFASNIGTWMQNVLLGAYGYELTGSATFVGLLFFAQLGPLLLLSTVGGVLADVLDRRRLLIAGQVAQLALSLLLAALALPKQPSHVAIVFCVLGIGICNALVAPALSAILPTLVPRRDLPGAVSLQSVQMNLSRVIGPAIGAAIYTRTGAATVFLLNALTYCFAVAGLLVARYDRRPAGGGIEERGMARLLSGFRVAWADPLIRRVLTIMFLFSFFSLTFIGLMPALAATNLHIRPRSVAYGLLYAGFGFGAAVGAIGVGTVLAAHSKARIARIGLLAFAFLLAAFGSVRVTWAAYPLAVVLGFAYFSTITSLSTVLQQHLTDNIRGRIVAIWMMAFGGTVPLGVLVGGVVANHSSITLVMLIGAACALGLAWYADLRAVGAPS
jgi:MFS family permease